MNSPKLDEASLEQVSGGHVATKQNTPDSCELSTMYYAPQEVTVTQTGAGFCD